VCEEVTVCTNHCVFAPASLYLSFSVLESFCIWVSLSVCEEVRVCTNHCVFEPASLYLSFSVLESLCIWVSLSVCEEVRVCTNHCVLRTDRLGTDCKSQSDTLYVPEWLSYRECMSVTFVAQVSHSCISKCRISRSESDGYRIVRDSRTESDALASAH